MNRYEEELRCLKNNIEFYKKCLKKTTDPDKKKLLSSKIREQEDYLEQVLIK